ncbi:MAG: ATP-binding cassette domain-containing protein [Clostridia bacterium]|nr:ATP-binding cassette domain-containing protein [Clostridia bacterium]
MKILETQGLCFSYEKGKEILNNVNLSISRGCFVGLLGSNGSGKTTLLQQLNGLLKPSSGKVLLEGMDLKKLKDRNIFSIVGLVFQNPDDQLFSFTVYEDVAYGVTNLGIQGEILEQRVYDALRLLDILDLKQEEIHKLSYGQRKRVAIAGVLAMRPQMLLLDEPTAGLDPMTSSNLMKTLKKVQKDEGVTIVVSTHEVDYIPMNCDYVYVLDKGRVVLEGIPQTVFGDKEVLRKANLRLPRIGHLMEILKDKDELNIDSSAMTISSARKAIKAFFEKKSGQ